MTPKKRTYGVPIERTRPLHLDPHPDSPGEGRWRKWADDQECPLAVDLYCGAGGLSLALEEAGFRVVLSVDTDPWALETHRHNFPGLALDADLADPDRRAAIVGMLEGLDVALIAGGPPCQPFSLAGRSKIRDLVREGLREAEDERRHLWRPFLEMVEQVLPQTVLMENVPDMALGDDMAVLRIMQHRLEELGYEVDARLVDTWLHGVAAAPAASDPRRLRDRTFVWPKPKRPPSLRDAIGDLPPLDDTTGSPKMRYTGRATTTFQRAARRGAQRGVLWDHITRPVRRDDRKIFNMMGADTLYSDLPKRLRRYRADIFDDKYKRLDWADLSRSITAHIAKDGYWYIHPEEARTLTVRGRPPASRPSPTACASLGRAPTSSHRSATPCPLR